MLTFYELDLGLNHVVRKQSEPTDPRANYLVQVPGGSSAANSEKLDGPSGVLVCCENHIIYKQMDQPQHRVPIPRRRNVLDSEDKGLIIVAGVMHKMKVCCMMVMLYSCIYLSAGRFLFLIAVGGRRLVQSYHRPPRRRSACTEDQVLRYRACVL